MVSQNAIKEKQSPIHYTVNHGNNELLGTSQISSLCLITFNLRTKHGFGSEKMDNIRLFNREFVITEFDCRFIFKKIDSALYCWYIYVKKYFSRCIYYFLVISIQILVWSVLLKLCHKK